MNIELPKLSGGVISAEASGDAGVVRVRFSGTADLEAKDDLEVFVKKLHREAVKHTATKVVVDFRELEFMNSSCFKIFVAWLAQVRDLEATQQYRIHLLSNPNLLWQRRSLAALSCFAVDLVAIET
jgi:anti-anti-sigma factor